MKLFDPRDRQISPSQAHRYATFEIVHTAVDFTAAFLFIVGSVLFFFEQTQTAGTVGFLVGSLFFAAKPGIRILREVWLAKRQDVDDLAKMAPEGPGEFELMDQDEDSESAGEVRRDRTNRRFTRES